MTLTDLRTAIRDYLDRPDIPDSTVGFWLNVVDGEINRELRDHPKMARRATFLASSRATQIPVPTDSLQLIALRVGETMWEQYPPGARQGAVESADPAFVVNGTCIDLFPECSEDTTFVVDYAAAITPLTDAEPENWVSSYAPDVYLYGALREACVYLKDDARLAVWDGLFRQHLARLSASGWGSNYTTAPRTRFA